ncbi:phage terminase small subunit [Motilimonas sp. 1_MG-2023]|uniref:phage terminase small subunit n=1 Tax=Motilimonas sp. 1_MG-2023 TaxID=3062672 RepID=UPI0026E3CC5D|nr:phage terminase small subunit [Motilimonas sp. 1_MG-2023]MDO6525448.1 phage terminase small subunit [Motilimonas sp. 1_MG-2023]
MSNLIRQHRQRVLAAKQGAEGEHFDHKAANQYELMLMLQAGHRRELKKVQSIERKAEVKAKYLPEYQAYIDGVITGNSGRQDDVLMTVLLWQIDAGNFAEALRLAAYAIGHDLQAPDRFERKTATLIAEEIAEVAMKRAGTVEQVPAGLLLDTYELTQDQDMFDQVRAKLHKAIGMAMEGEEQLTAAAEHYTRALELDERIGVKKLLEKVERAIKNNPAQAQPAG